MATRTKQTDSETLDVESYSVTEEAQPTAEGHELPPLPELDERMQDPQHPREDVTGASEAVFSAGFSQKAGSGGKSAPGASSPLSAPDLITGPEAYTPIPTGGHLKATAPLQMRVMHLELTPLKRRARAKDIQELLHLQNTATDRQIELDVERGMGILQQVEMRVQELLTKQRAGISLTRPQRNLLDFWFVDHAHRGPEAYQYAEMLRQAETVTEGLRWRR